MLSVNLQIPIVVYLAFSKNLKSSSIHVRSFKPFHPKRKSQHSSTNLQQERLLEDFPPNSCCFQTQIMILWDSGHAAMPQKRKQGRLRKNITSNTCGSLKPSEAHRAGFSIGSKKCLWMPRPNFVLCWISCHTSGSLLGPETASKGDLLYL